LKIYIISQWYYPEPDGRVSALAEGLVSKGHQVVVITAFPNYPQGKIYQDYRIKLRQWEEINGVHVLRLPIYPDHSHSAVKRALNYVSFSLSLFFLAPWFIKKPDIFWAYTPFVVLPVLWFKQIFNKPYVLEITDIWPDTMFATGMLKQGFLAKILNGIAKLGYKYASSIIVQNIGFKTCLLERGIEENKTVVIENWADETLFRPVDYNLNKAEEHNINNKFNIMFAGNMGLAQGLENIIDAAQICRDIKDIQFVFIGDGVCLHAVKQKANSLELENVCFIERKPLNEMADYFALADVLLVSLRDDPLFDITLPSKTQAYLACGKPILIVKRGEDAKMLEDEGCAIACEPDKPQALADAIMRLNVLNGDELTRMGECSLNLYKKRYTKEYLLMKMEKVLTNAV
jgi:glycosyltransferase involved in cell wall biosynthesis